MKRQTKSMKKTAKNATILAVTFSMAMGMIPLQAVIPALKTDAAGSYNYGGALQKSLMFYELQKSGAKSEGGSWRNNWRGDSCLNDGKDNGVDLTGGWYDAGDNVKFNLPMSYTAAMLAWSYLENKESYKTSGQEKYMLDELKFANNYFMKCHPEPYVYYYQVGNGSADHAFWGSAEVVEHRMERPSYKVTLESGGSAVCAETAASLAACAAVFKDTDPEYSAKCLKHAKELLNFAEKTKTDKGYTAANGFYNSWSGFYDELSWASVWIYKATGDKTYLDKAEQYVDNWERESQGSTDIKYSYTQCWDDVHYGAGLLLAMCDESKNQKKYKEFIENNMDFWLGDLKGRGGDQVTYTPGGLAWISQWGSNRYASTAAFLATVYSNWSGADKTRAKKCWDFAKKQADYILGSSGQNYVVGYDETSPRNVHHRTAHGAWADSLSGNPDVSRHVLMGALVGGPAKPDDSYKDDRSDYYANEVACDYNAGFTGLMASMYGEYGGKIDQNLTAVEKASDELYIEAAINAQDSTNVINFIEMRAIVYNHTAWPARVTDKLKFRFFVDISDVLASGASPEDMTVSSAYSQQKATISKLKPWDAKNGIYYTEIDLAGADIYPGGQSQSRCEVQFRIAAPGKWNYKNSPSMAGLSGSNSNNLVKATGMALYDDGKLVYGTEPDGKAVTPTTAPTAKPTTAPTAKPTTAPTAKPTAAPTAKPTAAPTAKPTAAPTVKPTVAPTAAPTVKPTTKPATTEQNDDWLHAQGSKLYDSYGNEVWLTGANWFGFNCSEEVFHGLWSADLRKTLKSLADHGVNLLRVPVSTELLYKWMNGNAKTDVNVNWSANADLVKADGSKMNSMEIFDKTMEICKEYGIKVMVDVHSPHSNNSGHNYELWYGEKMADGKTVTTDMWIKTWVWLVNKYKNDDTLIAVDLENEPHGKRGYDSEEPSTIAKWDNSTDENNWKYAAERCAKEILKVNPNILIMVEGIEQYPKEGYSYSDADKWNAESIYYGAWWGGNLRGVKDYPIDLGEHQSQLVYSPHDYGPLVYAQDWFNKDFTEKTLLDDYWYDSWAYIADQNIAPLLMGEWGGKLDGADNEKWLKILANYMTKNKINHTFWCVNPNSGDTGGLLKDDFVTWDADKYAIFEPTLWQDNAGKYIGLDHKVALGANGITVAEHYKENGTTPTAAPTAKPTAAPTVKPTAAPTAKPTAAPTAKPTAAPTAKPTVAPTAKPTAAPTAKPTAAPTARPTAAPTVKPTAAPTAKPTTAPSAGKLTVSASISSEWDTGLVGNITVENKGTATTTGWTVEFDFAGEITNLWCGTIESHTGNHYVVKAVDYNKNINANSQIKFGFNATKASGQTCKITNVTVK